MLGQHRSTQRDIPRGRDGEDGLVLDMVELAGQICHCGCRCISAPQYDACQQAQETATLDQHGRSLHD